MAVTLTDLIGQIKFHLPFPIDNLFTTADQQVIVDNSLDKLNGLFERKLEAEYDSIDITTSRLLRLYEYDGIEPDYTRPIQFNQQDSTVNVFNEVGPFWAVYTQRWSLDNINNESWTYSRFKDLVILMFKNAIGSKVAPAAALTELPFDLGGRDLADSSDDKINEFVDKFKEDYLLDVI